MREVVQHSESEWVLFDRESWDGRQPELFEHGIERVPVSGGRGYAWFVSDDEGDFVVRHYRRGGAIEVLLADRYLWTGIDATRAFREWRLLATLFSDGLPVPRPVAARVRRSGCFYRADLATRALSGVRSLADRLTDVRLSQAGWRKIGGCIRLFHDRGVYHADLNAHNILLDGAGRTYLIDFDRGKIRNGGVGWKTANLARLRRSLEKLADRSPRFCYGDGDFTSLTSGYVVTGRG